MSTRPPIKLSRLRDIGWTQWDPIGLAELDGGWESSEAADEYDTYLMQIVGKLRNGETHDVLVSYLVSVEADGMGMGVTRTTRSRAEATVAAIGDYLRGIV